MKNHLESYQNELQVMLDSELCDENENTISELKEKIDCVKNYLEVYRTQTDSKYYSALDENKLFDTNNFIYWKNLELYEIIGMLFHRSLETKNAFEEFNKEALCQFTDDLEDECIEADSEKEVRDNMKKALTEYEKEYQKYYQAMLSLSEYEIKIDKELERLFNKELALSEVMEKILETESK